MTSWSNQHLNWLWTIKLFITEHCHYYHFIKKKQCDISPFQWPHGFREMYHLVAGTLAEPKSPPDLQPLQSTLPYKLALLGNRSWILSISIKPYAVCNPLWTLREVTSAKNDGRKLETNGEIEIEVKKGWGPLHLTLVTWPLPHHPVDFSSFMLWNEELHKAHWLKIHLKWGIISWLFPTFQLVLKS